MRADILLVEDDDSVAHTTRRILTTEGFEVMRVSNASEALDQLQKNTPDLILLDILMPGLTPREFIEALKERGIPAKIMYFSILTEHDKTVDFQRERKAYMNPDYVVGYIEKPFDKGVLVSTITKTLKNRP